MNKFILILTLIVSNYAFALTDKEAAELKAQCLKSFSQEKNKVAACECMNKNLKVLVDSFQFQALIRHYKDQLSKVEKEKYQPLILMDIEIEDKCFKNPNYIAPKAQKLMKKK